MSRERVPLAMADGAPPRPSSRALGQRLLGQGWELGIWRSQDGLVLGIPVESGFYSCSFDFDISRDTLVALTESPRRRQLVACVLHRGLQSHITRGGTRVTEAWALQRIAEITALPEEAIVPYVLEHGLSETVRLFGDAFQA